MNLKELFKFNKWKLLIFFFIFVIPGSIFELGLIIPGGYSCISLPITIFPLIIGPMYAILQSRLPDILYVCTNQDILLFRIAAVLALIYWLVFSCYLYYIIKKYKKKK